MHVIYYTASDGSRLARGEVTPAGIRAATLRGDLHPAARTVGGIALFTREQLEAWLARRDARRHAREARPA